MRTFCLREQIVFWEINGETIFYSRKDKFFMLHPILYIFWMVFLIMKMRFYDNPFSHGFHTFNLLI